MKTDETPESGRQRVQMQNIAAGIAKILKTMLKDSKLGFSIVLFDFNTADMNNMAYAANGERLDVIKLYRELADKLEVDAQAKAINAAVRPG